MKTSTILLILAGLYLYSKSKTGVASSSAAGLQLGQALNDIPTALANAVADQPYIPTVDVTSTLMVGG